MGCDVTYLKVCVWNMGSLRCLMKNKCQNRVPGHPIYKVGHNLTGFNNILEGGIVPLKEIVHFHEIIFFFCNGFVIFYVQNDQQRK